MGLLFGVEKHQATEETPMSLLRDNISKLYSRDFPNMRIPLTRKLKFYLSGVFAFNWVLH